MKNRLYKVKDQVKKDMLLYVINNWKLKEKITIEKLSYLTGISHYTIIRFVLKPAIKEANQKIQQALKDELVW